MIREAILAVARTWVRRRTVAAVAATLLACWSGVLLGGCSKLFPHRAPGEQLYVDHCADCHGLDGRGNTAREMGQPYADLTDDVWKFGGDDTSIANAIREGSFDLMPGFQQQLNDQQIQELVAYLRVLRKRAADGAP
jgi:cbb3-type cytochrome c oxidase subunit III